MGLEKPQRPLMSRLGLGSGRAVPACGCALTPLYICRTATHLLICPWAIWQQRAVCEWCQLLSGGATCSTAQVVWLIGGRHRVEESGYESGPHMQTRLCPTSGPARLPLLGILWSCRVERRRFKMYGHETVETAGGRCQLLATYKSTFVH